MADTVNFLKKAANMFFKGLGKLLSGVEPLEREGKLGVEFTMHTNRGTDTEPSYTDVVVDAWGIKGKDKYYVDRLDFYESGTDNQIKLKTQFKPSVVDSNEEAVVNLINHWSDIGDANGNLLGEVMSIEDWQAVQNQKTKNADDTNETDTTDEDISEENTEESNDAEDMENADNGIASSKLLRATFSKIEGTSDIAVANIYANYSMVKASQDLLYVVESPEISDMVAEGPVTLNIVDDGEDLDVEECAECCESSVQTTFKTAFDALFSIYYTCSNAAMQEQDKVERKRWMGAASEILTAMTQLNDKMQHVGCDCFAEGCIDTIEYVELNSGKDAVEKASQVLYLLASNLTDNSTFDDIIKNLDESWVLAD